MAGIHQVPSPTRIARATTNDIIVYLGDDSNNAQIDATKILIAQGGALLNTGLTPTGGIIMFGGSSAPTGWLLCAGAAVSRTTYAALFAVIGTAFGVGDGSTTFNVPNFARRVPVGAGGSGTGTLGNAVGNTGGEETHVLTTAELAAHTHQLRVVEPGGPYPLYGRAEGTGAGYYGRPATEFPNTVNTGLEGSEAYGLSAGSGTAHNTIQPSLVVNYLIKT